MNLNVPTVIKQEFLNVEEEVISNIPTMDLNIPVKNEPIFDEFFPSIRIKSEPLPEQAFLEGVIAIKSENSLQIQEVVTKNEDNFIIHELETPRTTDDKPILLQQKQIRNNAVQSKANVNENIAKNVTAALVTVPSVADSPPILLNAQLRKRHKRHILPVSAIDNRKRYNIQGTTPMDPTTNSKASSIISSGSKKIINHLMNTKGKLRKTEENYVSKESCTITRKNDNQDTEKPGTTEVEEQTLNCVSSNNINKIRVQAQPENLNRIPLSSSKLSLGSPFVSELRVKCLCSLTGDTPTDNNELKAFFKEIYEETRRLNKSQQRSIKMLLLKAVSDAEESMEQGKCCGF